MSLLANCRVMGEIVAVIHFSAEILLIQGELRFGTKRNEGKSDQQTAWNMRSGIKALPAYLALVRQQVGGVVLQIVSATFKFTSDTLLLQPFIYATLYPLILQQSPI